MQTLSELRRSTKFSIILVLFTLLLTGCNSGGSPSAGNNNTGSGTAGTYTNGDGIPELTSFPTNVPASAAAGSSFTVNVPVDSDTAAIEVVLLDADTESNLSGYGVTNISGVVAQTVSVTVSVYSSATNGPNIVLFAANKADGSYTLYLSAAALGTNYYKVTGCTDTCSGTPTSLSQQRSEITLSGGIQGTLNYPVPVTSPFNGTVSTVYPNYFLASGLEPNAEYIATLSGMSTDLTLNVYNVSGNYSCTWNTGTTYDSCVASADASGKLWLQVNDASGQGGQFILSLASNVNQGSSIDPMPITLPYNGTVGRYDSSILWGGGSYYWVSGLLPNTAYTVTLSGMSADQNLYVFNTPGFGAGAGGCNSSGFGTTDDSCAAMSDASGNLWMFITEYPIGGVGGSFTLNVSAGGLANQGSITNPSPITSPYDGMVAYWGASYYQISGLTPNAGYTVTLSGMTANQDLDVYNTSGFSGGDSCYSWNSGTLNDSCSLRADTSGNLWIRTNDHGNGGHFTLTVTATGTIDQGSVSAPVAIASPYVGAVGIWSNGYYLVSGLTANSNYAVTMNGMTTNQNLYVYNTLGFIASTCSSANTGTTNEGCVTMSDATGKLWIKAYDESGLGGSFTLTVIAGGITNQGISTNPLSITSPYNGTQAPFGSSYYLVSGLVPTTSYTVTLVIGNSAQWDSVAMVNWASGTVYADNENLYVYNASGFVTAACSVLHTGATTKSCAATSDVAGNLWIKVQDGLGFGGSFTLSWQ